MTRLCFYLLIQSVIWTYIKKQVYKALDVNVFTTNVTWSKALSSAPVFLHVTFVLTPLKSICFSCLRILFFQSFSNKLTVQASPQYPYILKKKSYPNNQIEFLKKMLPQIKNLPS